MGTQICLRLVVNENNFCTSLPQWLPVSKSYSKLSVLIEAVSPIIYVWDMDMITDIFSTEASKPTNPSHSS